MEAQIQIKDKNELIVTWQDAELGFGELQMFWNEDMGRYTIDSEYLGIDNVIKIFQSLPNHQLTNQTNGTSKSDAQADLARGGEEDARKE